MLCLKVKRLKRLLWNHINKRVDIVESGKVIGVIVEFQTFLPDIAAVIRTGDRRLYLQKRNQLVTFAKEKQTMRNSDYRLSSEERAALRNVDVSGKEGFVPAETVLAKEVGAHGTAEREAFDAKARAWYYGEVLKERRKELGLTQKELADNVGCKRTYIGTVV